MKELLLVGAGLLLAAFVVLAIRFPRVSLLTLVALDVSAAALAVAAFAQKPEFVAIPAGGFIMGCEAALPRIRR